MSMNAQQLRTLVVRPTLTHMGMHSLEAENLLLGTAAQESRLGHYLHQVGGGPALGIYQMEPETHWDIWRNFLSWRPQISAKVRSLAGHRWVGEFVGDAELVGNLFYATALARIHYWRRPEPLPRAGDLAGLAHYWKAFYNTAAGRGTEAEFVENYRRYVGGMQ